MEMLIGKAGQPIIVRDTDDMLSYINMWKTLCNRGIQYYDISKRPNDLPSDEVALMKNAVFLQYKKNNSTTDIKIYQAEIWLTDALKNKDEEAFIAYTNQQQKVTGNLLYKTVSEEEITSTLNQYILDVKALAETYPEAKSLLDLFVKYKLVANTQNNQSKFCRYVLYRKLQFVSAASDLLFSHDTLFTYDQFNDITTKEFDELRELLVNDSDLDFYSLKAIAHPPKADIQPLLKMMPPMGGISYGNANYTDEYSHTVKEIGSVDKQLKDITLALRSTTTDGDREAYYDSIRTLNTKKDMLSYVAQQQYKKSSLINKAKVSSQDWISKNLFDKKKAGKDAAKVFFSVSAETIGKALYYTLTNQSEKVDVDKLKKKLTDGFVEAGLTLVGTYFFGPLGGSFTKKVMSFYRDEPADPYLLEFDAIKTQLSDGFTKIGTKLDNLSSQITKELNAVVSKLEAHTELSGRKKTFIDQKDHLVSLFKKVENTYVNLYYSGNSHVFEADLSRLDNDIQEALNKLVSILYHDDFDFNLHKEIKEPGSESLCGKFYRFNEEAAVSFHDTTRSLLNICNDIVSIGETYLDLREKWFSAMGATMFFFKQGKSTDPNSLLNKYWDAYKDRENFAANLKIELEILKLGIIGEGNIALLTNIETAVKNGNSRIDFISGFGLETIVEEAGDHKNQQENRKAQLYEYKFDNEYSSKGKFKLQPDRSFISRYVVAGYTFESNAKSYYTLYTQQDNQIPVPIRFHLRLMANDAIELVNVESNEKTKAHVIAPGYSPELSKSLEAFFAKNGEVIVDNNVAEFTLPVKDYYLSVGYDNSNAVLSVYKKIQSAKSVIGKYTFKLNFSDGVDDTDGLISDIVKLKPVINDNQASIGITVLRASDKKKASVSVVISDYAAMRNAGMNRGIEFVSTYFLKMPVLKDGVFTDVDVRTDNLRPFISNLLLAGDKFDYVSEERNYFGEVIKGNTGWSSLNSIYGLKAINKTPWFVQLCVYKDGSNQGSVFKKYNYTNKYSGNFILQRDGNFVMHDSTNKPITATGTNKGKDDVNVAYLSNEGVFVVIDTEKKEGEKFSPVLSPEISIVRDNKRKDSNRLYVNDKMGFAYDFRIESENGKYYAEFWQDEIDSGSLFKRNSLEFSLMLRKTGGEIVKKVLSSGHKSKSNAYTNFHLIMQLDGNIVAYAETKVYVNSGYGAIVSTNKEPLFASDTNLGDNESYVLCLLNDGKLFLAKTDERKIIKFLAE